MLFFKIFAVLKGIKVEKLIIILIPIAIYMHGGMFVVRKEIFIPDIHNNLRPSER